MLFRSGNLRAAHAVLVAGPQDGALAAYTAEVRSELDLLLGELIELTTGLLNAGSFAISGERRAEYLWWLGNAHLERARVFPEGTDGQKAAAWLDQALAAAEQWLPTTHPIWLGIVLNYIVTHYEILKDFKKAAELGREAFDKAISDLDQLDEASYDLATAVLRQIKALLDAWREPSAS